MSPLLTARPSWRILVPVALLGAAGLTLTTLSFFLDGVWQGYVANVAWLAAAAGAVLALAAARARATPAAKSGWTLILLGALLWTVGEALWILWLFVPMPASPNLADFCWYGFAVSAALGIHRLGRDARVGRSMTAFEIVPMIVAVCALVAALVWTKVSESALDDAGIAAALAYPVLYVSAALVVGQSVISGELRVRDNPGAAVMVVGVILQAVAFILWCPALLDGTYVAGASPCDPIWTLGLVFIAAGACFTGTFTAAPSKHPRFGAVLPGLTLAALAGVQFHIILGGGTTGQRLALASGIVVVGVALLMRSGMLHGEQVELLERERRASAEAAEARRELDGFFRLSIGLLGVASLETGCFTRLNPAWTDSLGWTLEDLTGSPFLDFVHPDDVEKTLKEMEGLATGDETLSFENRYRCKDGSYRWLAWKSRPDNDSGIIYATAHDVTEMRKLSVDLVEARDQALDASREKSEFLAMMSHEIRTPLNGVIGMTNLLASTDLNPEQRGYADTVGSSSEGLLTIINDILDFSKIEAGRLELDPVDFELRSVVEEVGEQCAAGAHKRGLELALDVSGDIPQLVHGDPGRIRQILINLVGNAIKFTAAGEVLVSARAQPSADGETCLRFEVRDTGVGVEPDDLPRLFESFTQADSSTTRRYGGSGLGLAISKRLAERMGGEIGATSTPGVGSTFWFTVQVAAVKDGPPPPARLDLAGARVLVVDDNATNREILEHQLRMLRMRPETAEDGPSALRRLRAAVRRGEPHELLLLDFNMPGLDGVELAQAVSSDPDLAGVPMILLTSSGGQSDEGREAGIETFLTKPVRQSRLFDAIARIMGKGALEEHVELEARPREAHGPASVRPRVLLAEDNEVNQAVATITLRKRGIEVDIAPDGAAAVSMSGSTDYAAIFMDCQMPVLDGYDATREIRKREGSGARLPIIAMTASAMRGDHELCLEAGMDDYLTKPLRLDELDRALDQWVLRRIPATDGAAVPLDSERIAQLRATVSDEAVLAEVARVYCRDALERLSKLAAAVAADDHDGLRQVAHALKGSSATIGATEVARIAGRIENRGDAETVEVDVLVDQLGDEVTRATAALRATIGVPA